MKFSPIVIGIIILSACSENDHPYPNNEYEHIQNDLIVNDYVTNEASEFGKRTYFDSLHFSIIRRKHANGKPYIESITNKNTKIDSWKEYHNNGCLKEKGQMTTAYHYYIGKWEYYSYLGKLDSIVDYDKKQIISYPKVIAIAKENGFEMPNMEVLKTYKEDEIFWEVNRWTELENKGSQSAEILLINSNTGETSIPEYQKTVIY